MSDKIKKEIFNGVGENVRALAQLFPSAVKDGEVDFAALKQELGEFVEVGAEKYDFTWAGKAKAKAESVSDILGRTLKYVKGDGVNEDTTQNLYIEGDNLEALKLLRNSYYNKIKMIYIDPPYNTGNDFVYKDNFAMTEEEKQAMAEAGEEIDEYGERLVKNNSDNSKYHTNWLNMMYPRLKIARDLLTDDGVIFISIDEIESENLKKTCDDIFGTANYLGTIVWKNKFGAGAKTTGFIGVHEYIFVYSKMVIDDINRPLLQDEIDAYNKTKDEKFDKRGGYVTQPLAVTTFDDRPSLRYPIVYNGKEIWPNKQWVWSKERLLTAIENNEVVFNPQQDGSYNLRSKKYLIDENGNIRRGKPTSFYSDSYTQDGTKDIRELFESMIFSYVKPVKLIKYLISLDVNNKQDKEFIVLDFFSGSATTAHAVMQLNAEDGGNRKYICVQLPEPCAEDSEAFKAGYKNICEIGKERIRRAGKKIKADRNIKIGVDKSKLMQRTLLDDGTFEDKYDIKVTRPDDDILDNLDIGFKVFKVADTNIRMFSNELNNVNVFGQIDIKDIDPEQIDFNNGATDLDVCYELLLRHRGIPLSSKVGELPIGERTYIIADSIVVCLDKQVTESLIEQLAAIDPLPNKYIFRDSSFGDDISLKENTMIYLQAIIEKNSGASKKAYTVEFI